MDCAGALRAREDFFAYVRGRALRTRRSHFFPCILGRGGAGAREDVLGRVRGILSRTCGGALRARRGAGARERGSAGA